MFPPKPCSHVPGSPLPTTLSLSSLLFSSLLSALRLGFAVVVFLARVLPSLHASFHGSYNPWPITRSGVAAEEEPKVV
jgi:hypothetical protein